MKTLLSEYRKKRNITQEEMSDRLEIPRITYRDYENGEYRIPEDIADKISKILMVGKKELFEKESYYRPRKIQ